MKSSEDVQPYRRHGNWRKDPGINTAITNTRGINVNMGKVICGGHPKNSVFTNPVFNSLKQLFMFASLRKRCRIFNQIIEGLTINIKVCNVAGISSEASQDFQQVSFTFGWFYDFQVFHSFCYRLYSIRRKKWPRNFTFLKKKNVLSGATLRPAFRRIVWYSLIIVNILFLICGCIIVSST